MSGHSKFANTKHRKARQDDKRNRIFTKISKEIIMAARDGGDDPNMNARLRMALDLARQNNMPKDSIKRAIDRALGNGEDIVFEEFTYEGYGPGGAAIYIEIATDNRNRTVADVRHILSKYGGSLGQNGCVAWMFERKGVFRLDRETCTLSEDKLFGIVLEAGGDDLIVEEDCYTIYTTVEDYLTVDDNLQQLGILADESGLEFIPKNTVDVAGETAEQLVILLDHLEDNDDIQRTFCNAVFEEE